MAKLRQPEQFKLWNHIQANIGTYMEERPNKVELAEKLTKEFGFQIKVSHINSTCKAMNVGWVGKVVRSQVSKPYDNRLYIPRQKWEAAVKLLGHFCTELNVPFPDELK